MLLAFFVPRRRPRRLRASEGVAGLTIRRLPGATVPGREPRKIERALSEVVLSARREGHSWTEIGCALGVTKQAAWRPFAGGVLAERFVETT
jgi:hypothetical protein